jgi:hypothetical protein
LANPTKTPQFLLQIRFDAGLFGYLDRYVALMEISQEALRHRDVPHVVLSGERLQAAGHQFQTEQKTVYRVVGYRSQERSWLAW